MLQKIVAFAVFVGATLPCAAAEKVFPYKAFVTTNDVYVRSGPGESYYPTEKLKSGTEVEVYRHDPGGWYAIRPLPESFSWVSARYLKLGKDGLGEITADKVASRVGSQFSDIREVTQTRLDRGELVELRGNKRLGAGDAAVLWYRIAPPAGEFRWIYGKYVDADFPANGVNRTSPDASRLIQHAHPSPMMLAGNPTPGPAGPGPALAPPIGPSPAGGNSLPAIDGVVQVPQTAMRRMSPEDFQSELDNINAELSIMLAEEPTVWNTRELALRAQSLLEQSQTAIERGKSRLVVTRIAQADDIRRRFETINVVRADIQNRNQQLASVGRSRLDATRGLRGDGRFDGTGRLTRVVPSTLGAPRYALVDDRGNIQTYVNPAPGVNLNYYVGHQVGVTGSRSYLPDQRTEQVTARNVSPLDTTRLR
jgi:hypothetical protein